MHATQHNCSLSLTVYICIYMQMQMIVVYRKSVAASRTKEMMNKHPSKRISIAPMDSPTMEGLEVQSGIRSTSAAATSRTIKTSIHVTALDGIANVNSLFTMAIFIGFSLTVPESATAAADKECTTSPETVRRLIVFEVSSFSFFLFSSLVALSLKLAINLLNSMDPSDPHKADVDPDHLRYGLFGSAIGSVMGCLFLLLTIVDFIRVKLGSYSCGGKPVYAVAVLLIFVGGGLLVYVATAVYASFFLEISSKDDD